MSQIKAQPFDPLDVSNYSLEKLPDIKGSVWMDRVKFIGLPLMSGSFSRE